MHSTVTPCLSLKVQQRQTKRINIERKFSNIFWTSLKKIEKQLFKKGVYYPCEVFRTSFHSSGSCNDDKCCRRKMPLLQVSLIISFKGTQLVICIIGSTGIFLCYISNLVETSQSRVTEASARNPSHATSWCWMPLPPLGWNKNL